MHPRTVSSSATPTVRALAGSASPLLKRCHLLFAILGVALLSAPASALQVAPSNPGLDHGPAVSRSLTTESGPVLRATEVQNIDTGLFYSTIQAAHDDAATLPGHTLEVQVASLTEGPQIAITKGVTLRGQTGSEVVLQSADTGSGGDARGWFLVDASATGFSVENLTLDGNGFKVWQGFRMFADDVSFDNCTLTDMQFDAGGPSYAGTAIVTVDGANLSVTNCTFSAIGRNMLFFFGTAATGGVVDNNVFTGKGVGDHLDYGIELGSGAVATCTNNTITDCRGVASSDGSTSAAMIITTYFGGGTAGTLSGNVLTGNTGAVAGGYDGADTSVIIASDNDLSGNDTYTASNTSTTTVHDYSANWWGSNVAATVAASLVGTAGGVDYTPWLDNGADTDGGTDGFQGDFATLNVDDDSPQVGATPRVQEGINLVTASTVNVMAGTYSGNLVLSSTVTLNGANANVSACGRVAGGIPSPATESVLTAASGIILELKNGCTGSTINGFAFDGALVAGNGIRSNGGPLTDVTIDSNWIGRTTSSGVFLNDSGTDITIRDNELDGSASGSGGYLHLDQDAFDGMWIQDNCVLNAASGTGIFVDGNHNIGVSTRTPEITGNTFSGNAVGANLGRFAFEDGLIDGNTFVTNLYDGLQGGIQSTTISGNLFDSNGRYGLALTGFGGSGDPTRGAQDCTITGNTFTGNVSAGLLYSSSQFPGTISTNIANDNDLVGNVVGASYAGTEVLDVTCNWWGDLGGPDAPSSPNAAGDDISGTTLVFWPWLDGSIVGTPNCDQYGGNNVAAAPDGDCISIANPCETVPVNFNRTDTSGARGVSATFQLSPELMLCSGTLSVVQGTWLAGFPGQTVFHVVDNGGGSYTVDQSILGETPLPCGETSGGELFTIDVKAAGGDGTGTITVTEVIVRDCVNAPLPGIPGPPASITIDTAAPTAVADLTASQVTLGNDSDGTTEITLNFTVPGDAVVTEVYRKGFGDYPEYDDAAGAVPAVPTDPTDALSNGWVLTSATTDGDVDETTVRDYYYFVLFTEDACENVSPPSNMTTGTLNYHLGDVSDGSTPGQGDNLVAGVDLSLLGSSYGLTIPHLSSVNYLDVGPTSTNFVDGLPDTDNEIQFEDLMMFAINHGEVSRIPGSPGEMPIENPQLALVVDSTPSAGGTMTARLVLSENARSVKGIHSDVSFDASRLELQSVTQGSLLADQAASVFFKDLPSDGAVVVDAAVMGRDLTVQGSGDVAVLTFRVIASGAAPVLEDAALRGRDNRRAGRPVTPVLAETPASQPAAVSVPERLELLAARPNPFSKSTDIMFRLPATSAVSVKIYDVTGRHVRTLVNRTLAPGEHRTAWDGRGSDGRPVGSGIYFYTFRADGLSQTHRLVHTR
ncbi:right-handed parallel beta-helix repeat-containing protein [bacterium]|nr:right-handed parallel beta-helix repeat-containing protein [bacterium]